MKFTRIVAIASLVVASVVGGVGTSQAAPAQDIRYHTNLVDKTVVTTLEGGTFKIAADRRTVDIVDTTGAAVLRVPLSFTLDSIAHPVAATVANNGTEIRMTPDMSVLNARPVLVRPVASPQEDQRALSMFSSMFSVGTAIGTFLGTAAGVVVGGVIGCVLGSPFFGLGCLPAATVGASLGGIIGMVAVGGPVLVYSAIDLVSTLMAKPGTTKYNYTTPVPAPPKATEAPTR
ncbi:ammonium transporter [Aldersonia sp. NBC_00410]|uniref:ammonium transporter n=1 Tax=Aldersonia sp. NBC_00410 TaxID=2975954 RepID=UPI00224FD8FD|nr:ammonium transporter [Aldersonia sp. NBC_00410]MCX5042031.1 ammonium transporter [Aldersonia sp. NBC_00410]